MRKVKLLSLLIFLYSHAFTQEQEKRIIRIIVLDEQKKSIAGFHSAFTESGFCDGSFRDSQRVRNNGIHGP